ncbi:hypothetical protein QE152_g7173 [Popillia japonica]|uniref:Reverse transcriptase domain-containing protein n=1 Tax=Popillia japonica TaxID=7064 RepID=A0AAW1MG02_POPJA
MIFSTLVSDSLFWDYHRRVRLVLSSLMSIQLPLRITLLMDAIFCSLRMILYYARSMKICPDDFVLCSKHEDLSVAVRALNVALTKFNNWCDDHNFTISFSKTKAMVFTRKNLPQELPFINVRGVRLEIVESIRYLGVIFDRRLTWANQVVHVAASCQKNINIIKSLTSTWWGSDF